MELRDWAYTDDGNPINGATVEVYVSGGDTATDTTTTDATGMWEFTNLTAGSDYDVKITSGSSVRWLKKNVSAQYSKLTADQITDADGTLAPLLDASVTADMLQTTVIPDYSVTADTATTPTDTANKIDVWFGGLKKALKAATGETNWWDSAGTTLKSLVTTVTDFQDVSTGHHHDGTDSRLLDLSGGTDALNSNTSVSTSWANGPSLSLATGTWLVTGYVTLRNQTNQPSLVEARIWDGSTSYALGATRVHEDDGTIDGYATISLSAIVTLAATTTVKISCREGGGTGEASGSITMMRSSLIDSDTVGTRISAVRVA